MRKINWGQDKDSLRCLTVIDEYLTDLSEGLAQTLVIKTEEDQESAILLIMIW